MNYKEKQKFVRSAIIESHTNAPGHLIDNIQETLNHIDDDESLGTTLDSFDPQILASYFETKLNGIIIISWCDSIDDIINNHNRLFDDLVSPN